MAQHDMNIANQGFPAFRSDLNNALSAIQTTHSGTSRPTGAVAGQIWLDTTSATSPTLKYYDGADDISLATIDHSANTVNWLDSTVSITGLSTTATGTVLTLSDTASTSTVNLIIDNQKQIRFRETTANGTNYVALQAPASVSADLTFTLPATDGTNGQALITNGSGVLSFSTISTSLATPLAVVGNATAGSEIRLPEDTDNGSNYVALKAPDTLASNLTLTLPSADGSSGQVLQTNGSGVLSFASVGGKVLQVVHTRKTTVFTTSSSSYVDVTGFTATITPSSASSKILVMCNTNLGSEDNSGGLIYFKIVRGVGGSFQDIGESTDARTGEHAHIDRECAETATHISTTRHNLLFLESPNTTSAVTFKAQAKTNGSNTLVIGASGRSDTNSQDAKYAVDIILMEIGA